MTDSQFATLCATILAIFCLMAGYTFHAALQPDQVPCTAELRDGVGNKAQFSMMCKLGE